MTKIANMTLVFDVEELLEELKKADSSKCIIWYDAPRLVSIPLSRAEHRVSVYPKLLGLYTLYGQLCQIKLLAKTKVEKQAVKRVLKKLSDRIDAVKKQWVDEL